MHAHAGVAGARAAGDQADAGLAGQLAIGLGHVGGAGLVAAGDDPDAIGNIGQGVEQRQIALAGHAEHVVDPVGEQALDDPVGGGGLGAHVDWVCSIHSAILEQGNAAFTGDLHNRPKMRV